VGVTSAEGVCSPKAVFQAVKAICALAGGVETLHLTHALNGFAQACTAQVTHLRARLPQYNVFGTCPVEPKLPMLKGLHKSYTKSEIFQ
jgi:hypothetical protein